MGVGGGVGVGRGVGAGAGLEVGAMVSKEGNCSSFISNCCFFLIFNEEEPLVVFFLNCEWNRCECNGCECNGCDGGRRCLRRCFGGVGFLNESNLLFFFKKFMVAWVACVGWVDGFLWGWFFVGIVLC